MPIVSTGRVAAVLERRALVFESLAAIAIISLATSWIMQPYLVRALAAQGAVAQQAAQGALWLSGILSPIAALGKALVGVAVCWACCVFLGERPAPVKLISVFCVAEIVFSLRDLISAGILVARGMGAIHTTGDLMVAFGANAFVHGVSPLQRISVETWDLFTVAWASVLCALLRGVCKVGVRPAIALAVIAFAVRTLFSAAAILYTI